MSSYPDPEAFETIRIKYRQKAALEKLQATLKEQQNRRVKPPLSELLQILLDCYLSLDQSHALPSQSHALPSLDYAITPRNEREYDYVANALSKYRHGSPDIRRLLEDFMAGAQKPTPDVDKKKRKA